MTYGTSAAIDCDHCRPTYENILQLLTVRQQRSSSFVAGGRDFAAVALGSSDTIRSKSKTTVSFC